MAGAKKKILDTDEKLKLFDDYIEGKVSQTDLDQAEKVIYDTRFQHYDIINFETEDEVVCGFLKESFSLSNEMLKDLNLLEVNLWEGDEFFTYAQKIDRIMGTAYTLGFQSIGDFCQLGKKIGFKAHRCESAELKHFTFEILVDSIEIIQGMLIEHKVKSLHQIDFISIDAFSDRLHWLVSRLDDSLDDQDAPVPLAKHQYDENAQVESQASIDDLLSSLGL